MNCCDDNGGCRQGRDCPVRTCRQRAGKPADYTPFRQADSVKDYEALRKKQAQSDFKSIVFIAGFVLAVFIIVLVTA